MRIIKTIVRGIDWFIERTGKAFAWLMLPLIVIICYEVIARYLFRAPTIWVFDVSFMIGTSLFLIGLSYVYLLRGHVRVDILSKHFPPKFQAILNLVFRIIFFFPLMWALLLISFDRVFFSIGINETYQYGIWHPSLIPFRIIILIAFVLLALEGISQFVRELETVIKSKEL